MFPGRRAILYHYEYPWLTRTLKITEFDVTNGVITVGATTDLGNVGAYAIHPDGTRIAFFEATGVTIHELNLATGEVRHLFDLPSGHHFHLFGGYVFDASALVLIVYDEESLYDYDSVMVIDLDATVVGVGAWEALDLAGFGNKLMGIEPAKTSRAVLFDAMNVLYILNLDTLGLTTVGPGHMGTWGPDDSAVIYIDLTNVWTFGPASKIDLLTGEISPFTNPRTSISEPHWR